MNTTINKRTIVERIGDYAAGLQASDIGPEVLDYTKRILLDSLACAYGGLESEPARIVRRGIGELDSGAQSTLIGKGIKANAQFAALANGVAIRYQDYNDVYFGPAWTAHPSDTIATVLAAAEWSGRSGMEFLLGMIAAYEVQMRFSDLPVAKNLWHRGWHHTAACSYAGAAGAAKATVAHEFLHACQFAYDAYERMLESGVAREVARIVLPLTIYSSAYVTINARSLMNFLSLRTQHPDSHFPSFPQREIEMVGERYEAEFARLMPLTHAAFVANGRVAP